MSQRHARTTLLITSLTAACLAICHGQAQNAAGTSGISGAQPTASAPAGASSWKAGGSGFSPAGAGAWGGNKGSFGSTGGSWTAGSGSFEERVQAGGIWRDDHAISLGAVGTPATAGGAESSASHLRLRTSGSLSAHSVGSAGRAGRHSPTNAHTASAGRGSRPGSFSASHRAPAKLSSAPSPAMGQHPTGLGSGLDTLPSKPGGLDSGLSGSLGQAGPP